MEHRPSTPLFDPELQAALHAELAAAASSPALRPLVLHPEPDLGPRFVGYWRQLSALPRRTRRSLQRQWKRSLAAIALLMALGQVPTLAATIPVDGSTCTLVDAITAANTDAQTGGCPAGNGADTLVLAAGSTHTLTTVAYGGYENATGLPLVTSTITITGNNSTIERGTGAPAFRLLVVSATGDLTLRGLTLRGGYLYGADDPDEDAGVGGGVDNRGTLTISNSTVSGNGAGLGGGVHNRGTLTISDSTVSGNGAGLGGGVHNRDTLTISNSTVSGNGAYVGGGVRNSFGALTIIAHSTVSGNVNPTNRYGMCIVSGGGVSNAGTLTISNSTVSGNTSGDTFSCNGNGGKGGGVSGVGTLTITDSTVSGNKATGGYDRGQSYPGYGGGVSHSGTLTISRSLISGNTADDGPEVRLAGTVHADAFNLFGLNGAAGVSGFSPGPTDIVPSGPLSSILGPLADNGGPTRTHALVAGSPAVDAVARGCPPPFTDQRGFARPADGDGDGRAACDVGAFELAARPLPTCATAQPTRGCTVNGVANRLCRGTAGNDEIFGTARDDMIFGLDANDRINGLDGNDLICGGKGNDILRGKLGRDRIFGGAGDDNLQGGSGNDQLSGEGGNDLLLGDRGDDALDGGVGADRCNGGANGPAGDTATHCETVFGVP